jgi:uncharacterized protein (DUF433 family)
MKFTCINIQGNLISEEILQKIGQADEDGQQGKDFGFDSTTNLRSEIEYAWSRIKLDWSHFRERSDNLPANDQYGTTLSRKWLKNFLDSLGFELQDQKTSLKGDNGQEYRISQCANNLDNLPVHLVGFIDPTHPDKNTLDTKSSGGTSRLSPHATVQEYLNVTEHVYGIASNGLFLRLIRDSGRLVKLTYIEFDLKKLLEEDRYNEFTVLYRLLHATRFPRTNPDSQDCLLEKYYRDSIETGNRIRDGLSLAVKESLIALGKGFLQHESNAGLREDLVSAKISHKDFYRQLLRLIYRLLFLMVTEERDLVYNNDDTNEELKRKKKIYHQFYSVARLRKLSVNKYLYEKKFTDLWQGLVNTFDLFADCGKGEKLGILPLDGDLFSAHAIQHIEGSLISNQLLLECIRNLNEFTDINKNLVPINYRSLDVEELGSVYEGLLELHPVIENIEASNPEYINFTFHEGTDRKTTGSYYTRPDLVNELIKSALIPVIENRIKENSGSKEKQSKALLSLKVCDAASGSGHMLLAAARTIAWYLARIESDEDNPAPSVFRSCLRNVIQHCVYGVDMNPDAVELCKLALWLESHNSGKPLSFLDHKIRCGNSLVGVTDLNSIRNGIPDNAFNALTTDDKAISKDLKKSNASFGKTRQINLFDHQYTETESLEFSSGFNELENIYQDSIENVTKAKRKYLELRKNANWWKDWRACNLWTSAFFFEYSEENSDDIPTSERLQKFLQDPEGVNASMIDKSNALSLENKFFHWPLEFPDVFEQGGFDVILGNPPWERIKLQQQEFFATRNPEIANASNASARTRMIAALPQSDPALFLEYKYAVHQAEATGKFLRESGRYKLTAVGDINTYSTFAELASSLINSKGSAGIIVPTGIATDESNKAFFGSLIENNALVSLFDFENREKIFKDVDSRYKFSLLTVSGNDIGNQKARFGFFLTKVEDLTDKMRVFNLSKDDLVRLNPNTKTCPVFRTSYDADLSKRIFNKVGVFVNDISKQNDWGAYYIRLVDLGDHQKEIEMIHLRDESTYPIPVYEAKLFWQMDHRHSTFAGQSNSDIESGSSRNFTSPEKEDSANTIAVRYYAKRDLYDDLNNKYPDYKNDYYIVWRDISNSTNERTSIASVIPRLLASRSCPGIGFQADQQGLLLLGNLNSIVYDYFVRQKISGIHFNWGLLKQTPILSPADYSEKIKVRIAMLSFELAYTAWDLKLFADDIWRASSADLKQAIQKQFSENKIQTGGHQWNPPQWCVINESGCPLPPFKWSDDRRNFIKAELDAQYAMLYDLNKEELRYILDPQEVYGENFPGETFRVLKEKEIRHLGEYRTMRLVLEAWDRLVEGTEELTMITQPSRKPTISVDLINIPEAMKEFSLHEGIYRIRDVVQITHLTEDKTRRWFRELSKEGYEGISGHDTDVNHLRISFHGLIELVVIGTLRTNGFTLKKILKARKDLQQKTGKIYPFATNNMNDLKIAGRAIIFRFDTGDVTLDGSGQYNLGFITEFFKNIEFDAQGVALKLFPLKDSKLIIVDPKQGGGKAVITGKGVWAETIQLAYTGPDSVNLIKEQYELEQEEVLAAIEYCN